MVMSQKRFGSHQFAVHHYEYPTSPHIQDDDTGAATAIPNDIHDFVERMDKDEEDEDEVNCMF